LHGWSPLVIFIHIHPPSFRSLSHFDKPPDWLAFQFKISHTKAAPPMTSTVAMITVKLHFNNFPASHNANTPAIVPHTTTNHGG
jgi:hypothetical protein